MVVVGLCIILALSSIAGASEKTFMDVSTTDWYYSAVEYVVTKELFSGTSSTTFSPNAPMTRGMFVTVLGRQAGINASSYSGSDFTDVSTSSYYAPYIKWAAAN